MFVVYEGVPNVPSCFKNSPAEPPASPKLLRAVPASAKSDKLLVFANFVPTVVVNDARPDWSDANEADNSPSVSNVEPAVPIISSILPCTNAVDAILVEELLPA